MNTPHYQYFLALEEDLEESIKFAEIDSANDAVFSIVYLKILVSTCIEIEATLKQLCQRYSSGSSPNNINELKNIVTSSKPNYHLTEIKIPRYGLKLKPWDEWGAGQNPDWWRAYNDAKHDRTNNYSRANQKNVILALSALFCNLIYLYADATQKQNLSPQPRLFYFDSLFPGNLVYGSTLQLP